jgi:predicted DsbA family dithiol-disulfide isomerase
MMDAVVTRPVEAAARTLAVEVVSDVICPWCFVGKRRMEQASRLLGDDLRLDVRWRPFQLNPTMPKEGLDRRTYRMAKFGSWEHSQALDAQIAAVGHEVGVAFRHDLMARTPNTFDAHRLIWLAGQEGKQDEVVEALFRAYFTEGRDIGDSSVLADIAAEAGLPRERATGFLRSDEGSAEVSVEEAQARRLGISGVPTILVGGVPVFSGALRAETMAAKLREASLRHAA